MSLRNIYLAEKSSERWGIFRLYVVMMRLGDVSLRAVNAWIRHCTEAATGEHAARETNGERQRNTGQKAEKAAGMRRGSLPSYCASDW